MSRRRVDWPILAWILLIAGAALLAYGRSLNVFFSQDDFFFLARADRVASVGDFVRALAAPDHFYRPVPRVVLFVGELRLFGLNPGAFHLVNLGLHACNAVLLFLLCRRLSGSTLLAGLAGLFFVSHHIPFLAVYWLSGVQDLCMTFLALVSVHTYLLSLRTGRSGWWAISLLAFALALLSKETAVSLPLTLLLAGVVWQRRAGLALRKRQLLLHTVGYAAVLGLYLLLRSQKAAAAISDVGPYAWAFSSGVVFKNLYAYLCDTLYVRHWLWTAPQRAAWTCGVFLALVGTLLATSRRHRAMTALGLAWFVVSLLPLLFLSERAYSFYAYFALAGAAIAVGVLLAGALGRIGGSEGSAWPARQFVGGIVLCLIVGGWLWFTMGQIRTTEAADPVGILAKSDIAQRALAECQALYPALAPGSTLCVEGLTERDVWAVGRGDMFRLYYPGVTVLIVTELEASGAISRCDGVGYVYRYGGDR